MASPSTERVNQHLLTSLLPAPLHRLAATLKPPPSPSWPIRSLSSTQPLKRDKCDWTERGRQHVGTEEGGFSEPLPPSLPIYVSH